MVNVAWPVAGLSAAMPSSALSAMKTTVPVGVPATELAAGRSR